MFPTSIMCAINEIPIGALPLHFGPFPVRSISSSEMASEQKSRREGFGGSCALRPLVFCLSRTCISHPTILFDRGPFKTQPAFSPEYVIDTARSLIGPKNWDG